VNQLFVKSTVVDASRSEKSVEGLATAATTQTHARLPAFLFFVRHHNSHNSHNYNNNNNVVNPPSVRGGRIGQTTKSPLSRRFGSERCP